MATDSRSIDISEETKSRKSDDQVQYITTEAKI